MTRALEEAQRLLSGMTRAEKAQLLEWVANLKLPNAGFQNRGSYVLPCARGEAREAARHHLARGFGRQHLFRRALFLA